MSKIKMRCTTCGKWFQSANAKEVTCPDCVQKARKEKLAAKTAPPSSIKTPGQGTARSPVPPPPKPKPASGGTSRWFDAVDDVKVSEPDQPPQRPKLPSSPVVGDTRGGQERPGNRGPGGYRDERGPANYREGGSRGPGGYRDERGPGNYREGGSRGPAAYRPGGGTGIAGGIGQRPRQPMEGGFGRGPRPGVVGEPRPERPSAEGRKDGKPARAKAPKPPTLPKPKREKIPPPEPFTPTPEQITQVEARYIELAVPAEFDGIRTQIAQELGIPKKAIKKIVKELRDRQGIPSWWEIQTYKGDAEELEKIKTAYLPHLPLPPIGVHKTIAEELSLKPGDVYQAIKAIRLEMNLPQYNDPTLHGIELTRGKKERSAPEEAVIQEPQEEQAAGEEAVIQEPQEEQAAGEEAVIQEPQEEQAAEASSPAADTAGETAEAAATVDETPAETVAAATAVDSNDSQE